MFVANRAPTLRLPALAGVLAVRDKGELPLVNLEKRFGVFWSPKSACTSTVIWFIHTMGRAAEARRFNEWPHEWRMHVYSHEPKFLTAIAAFDATWPTLRVIRDPYQRATSIYRHVLQYRLEAERIAAFLKRDIRAGGFSFVEFLEFLAASKLDALNPHVRVQRKPLESEARVTHVVNVSRRDLFGALESFERELGLRPTGIRDNAWLKDVEGPRRTRAVDFDGDLSNVRHPPAFARDGAEWPRHKAFLTPQTRALIEKIYAIDFAAYGAYL